MSKLSQADTREYFKKYLMKQAECGSLGNLEDDNWNVKYSDQYYYILKTGSGARDMIDQRSWIKEKLDSSGDFDYYRADLSDMDLSDKTGPDLNLAALTENVKPGIEEKVEEERSRLMSGTFDVFYGPITDNEGNVRVKAGQSMTDDSMLNDFFWYVEGVVVDEAE